MANLNDLAAYLRQMAQQVPTMASTLAATACTVGITDLVNVTPVDTGAALSNWQVTLGTATAPIIPPYVPSQRGKTRQGTWAHTIDPSITREANIPPTLAAAQGVLSQKQSNETIHLQNNVPYIVKLNNGSSAQAPAGFIDRAELLIQDYIKKATT
jgi:hypothetical protein